MSENRFQKLPAVSLVLAQPRIQALLRKYPQPIVVGAIREMLSRLRKKILLGAETENCFEIEAILTSIEEYLRQSSEPRIRTVINATGIILHTNLGRSPLAETAAQAAYQAGRGYLNLELDLETGKRSSRQNPIREILTQLTGAESATVVNNCAAATVIVLRALAAQKEVIVSRGQLIEIGGSFRIPDIMTVSGGTLREVGTTNITRLEDFEKAITPNTGLLMRIHTSNYRIRGFTKSVSLEDLIELGKRYQIPVVDDVGSGAMVDLNQLGFTDEPVVSESVKKGADIVLFSGDKLLGGPQAGLIVGKKKWIERIEKDPLMRALRLDKMTLAALESTFNLYRDPTTAWQKIPTLQMLNQTQGELRPRLEKLLIQWQPLLPETRLEIIEDVAYVGGGTLPDQPVPTVVFALQSSQFSVAEIAQKLRTGQPAVLARVQQGQVRIDLRTVRPDQESALLEALQNVFR